MVKVSILETGDEIKCGVSGVGMVVGNMICEWRVASLYEHRDLQNKACFSNRSSVPLYLT